MLQISPLKDGAKEEFEKLFESYHTELGCGDNVPHLVGEYIIPDLLAGLIKIDILRDGGKAVGFVIYQIDDITNDWNLKEGWGDVREIYVLPENRGQGFGKFLLYTAEMKLKESGATKSFALPAEGAEEFFTACGYKKTEDYSEDLDCFIYEKLNLNNCECGGKK